MKITLKHRQELERRMEEEAIRRGASSIPDWVARIKEAYPDKADSPQFILSFLLHGEALNFLCEEIYLYADDAHLATFLKSLMTRIATLEL